MLLTCPDLPAPTNASARVDPNLTKVVNMLSMPKWLLLCGFVIGLLVLLIAHWVIASHETFRFEDFFVAIAVYVLFVGGTLSVPWVLLPVIAEQPLRHKRLLTAVLASLLPAVVAVGVLVCVFQGWDASRAVKVSFCLSIGSWFLPTIGAIVYSFANQTSRSDFDSRKTNGLLVGVTCVGAPLAVGAFFGLILIAGGWATRTESPNPIQVAHAREFLLIHPDLNIEPLAYYVKDGMDYMVRFKFIAKTDDPGKIFDRSHVDASIFSPKFEFPPGEATHHETWWDISSRPMSGGYIRVPDGRTLAVGYVANDDSTFTVYAWRHEGAFELNQAGL